MPRLTRKRCRWYYGAMRNLALRHYARLVVVGFAIIAVAAGRTAAQTPIDSSLLGYIASIRAIDSHAHPIRFVVARMVMRENTLKVYGLR